MIVLMSIPLAMVLFLMVRHAGPIRPVATAFTGALALASLASAGLTLFHGLDATIMVLVWHMGTVALIVAVLSLSGRRLFSWLTPRRRADVIQPS